MPGPKVGIIPSSLCWSVTSQSQPEENIPRVAALKFDWSCARDPNWKLIRFAKSVAISASSCELASAGGGFCDGVA